MAAPLSGNLIAGNNSGGGAYVNNGLNGNFVQNSTTGISVAAGSGSSGNIPPGLVGGMLFVKT